MSCSSDIFDEIKIKSHAVHFIETMESADSLDAVTLKTMKNDYEEVNDCHMTDEEYKNKYKPYAKEVFNIFRDSTEDDWKKYVNQYADKKVSTSSSSASSDIPEELRSLSSDKLNNLGKMCSNNETVLKIRQTLSKLGITQVNSTSIWKMPKGELCGILTKARIKSPRISPVRPSSPVRPPSPVRIPSPKAVPAKKASSFDLEHCTDNTVKKLLEYIEKRGWNPTSKEKKTKASLCDFIHRNLGKSEVEAEEIIEEIIAKPSEKVSLKTLHPILKNIDGCEADRKNLTIPAIQSLAKSKKWDTRSDYPKPKDKKSIWCSWLRKVLDEDIGPSPSPRAPSPISRKCGLLKTETEQEMLDDLNCGDEVCNLERNECESLSALGPGLAKLTFKGRDIVGPVGVIEELRAKLFYEDSPMLDVTIETVQPSQNIHKGKIVDDTPREIIHNIPGIKPFTPAQVIPYIAIPSGKRRINKTGLLKVNPEQEKKAAEAAKKLQEILGINIPTVHSKPPLPSHAPRKPPKLSIVAEEIDEDEPSEIQKLTQALRNISDDDSDVSVRLSNQIGSLREKINMCTGISS